MDDRSSTVEESVPLHHQEVTPLKVGAIHRAATAAVSEEAYEDEGCGDAGEWGNQNSIPPCSLAFCPSTPGWARYGVPLVTLVTHGIFLYGQIAPLSCISMYANADVWVNATTEVSRDAFANIGWDDEEHFVLKDNGVLHTITFMMGIEDLWNDSGVAGLIAPQFFAVWGFFFSGVWPHLKLWLVLLVWYAPFYNRNAQTDFEQRRRQVTLHWLSFLGKWSCLSEVLVSCQMLGVLFLEWQLDAGAEQDRIKWEIESSSYLVVDYLEYARNSASLCTDYQDLETCNVEDISGLEAMATCVACEITGLQLEGTEQDVLNGVEISGGVNVRIEIAGMVGIYFFCIAVILSVLLNVVVEVMDSKARHYYALQAQRKSISASYNSLDGEKPDSSYQQAPLKFSRSMEEDDSPLNVWDFVNVAMALGVVGLVFAGVFVDTMERNVVGAYPTLLGVLLGNDWSANYSLASLMKTTNAGGGWDFLLMLTFGIFVLIGPMTQALLIVLRPANRILRSKGIELLSAHTIKRWITFVNNFVALDVFCFAACVVSMLITPASEDFFSVADCARILNFEESRLQTTSTQCLEVMFVLTTSYWLFVGGAAICLVMAAIDAARAKPSSESNDSWED